MLEVKEISKTFNKGTINEKMALNKLSLSLDEGDFVTIIGGNGAGKSTLLNALSGVFQVDEGDIIIDGISINDLTRENVHDLFTMVLQDTWLFNGTILENIKYNNEKITDNNHIFF